MSGVLDLFCGSGGASIGYAWAGLFPTGVDIANQPNYPFPRIHQLDALSYATARLIDDADLVHASPPCQGYSRHVSSADSQYAGTRGANEPRLIAAVRTMLIDSGKPYVIENVVGARDELRPNLLLCGTMFGLPIPRHRLFETSFPVPQPFHPPCSGVAKRFAETKGWDPRDMTVTGKGRRTGTTFRWMEIMGWPLEYPVTQHGLREAIPPLYTEYVGQKFLALRAAA